VNNPSTIQKQPTNDRAPIAVGTTDPTDHWDHRDWVYLLGL